MGGGKGFEVADNALHLYWPGGDESLPEMPKTDLARQLVARIAERFLSASGTTP